MSICCCSLAGTAACKTCSNNPFAETPPPVRTYTITSTDPTLIIGRKTNADRIRGMTDEEMAEFLTSDLCEIFCDSPYVCNGDCATKMIAWLKEEATDV